MTSTNREPDIIFMFRESAKAWQTLAAKTLPILAEAATFMASQGWWLLGQLSVRQYQAILDARASVTPESLTQTIVYYANKPGEGRLRKIVDGWAVPAFVARRHIFGDALWAHEQSRFNVSVPALIAQAEGIVRTSLRVATHDAQQPYHFEKARKAFAAKLRTITRLTKTQKQALDVSQLRAVENLHNLAVVEKVFCQFDPSTGPTPKTLNRHAIAHGVSTDYGTVENSTKCFLFLDMLHGLCAQVEETA